MTDLSEFVSINKVFSTKPLWFGGPDPLGPARVPRWALKSPAITIAVVLWSTLFISSSRSCMHSVIFDSSASEEGAYILKMISHSIDLLVKGSSVAQRWSLLTFRVTAVMGSDFLQRKATPPQSLCRVDVSWSLESLTPTAQKPSIIDESLCSSKGQSQCSCSRIMSGWLERYSRYASLQLRPLQFHDEMQTTFCGDITFLSVGWYWEER